MLARVIWENVVDLKPMTDCSVTVTELYKMELFISHSEKFRIHATKAVKSNNNFWARSTEKPKDKC